MKKFALTNQAKQDLRGIGRYTKKKWGIQQRNHYLRKLDKQFAVLGKNPKLGKACDEIREGYRLMPEGKHIIFYRICEDGIVEIVRVLHESMDHTQHVLN